ncbi:FAD-linked oxidase [Pandoraea thiooxydans]|uniref:FAD-linked oxidase n=1 Tax=Pandoraea thiooxydans TaxID=445709 RepID=A0A0G3ERM3_9BURK|nr:FAD-binding oxidoreductase [Pandoraea thiooxydans]AKJ67947.1 FAD-linked oxidase [Pandoraea thiooxydans]APR95158.1 FAD-linked oxidase [Pandoraea thiooxydans]
MSDIFSALRDAVGEQAIRTGAAINPKHFTDWTRHAPAQPLAVVFARSTEQVAAVLRLCNAHGQPVVPQGGMTGLAGGAIPGTADIVVSLEQMAGIEEIDPAAATMTVLAGTPLQVIQEAAREAGFEFGLDLGARGSCQIGGNIATNAGGTRVIQSGMTRDLVLGLEVVLADGTVLSSLNKMIKNNTGYDLKQLFIGSEGTLGVITRAVLRLQPQRTSCQTALCALPDYDTAVRFLHQLRRHLGGDVSAFELMWPSFFELGVSLTRDRKSPFAERHPLYALVEQRGFAEQADAERFGAALSEALEAGWLSDAVLAQSGSEANALWAIRECTAEFPQRLAPINFDISLPIGKIGAFADECQRLFDAQWGPHLSLFFGHIGDSNLHVTVDGNTVPGVTHEAVDQLVYSLLRRYGGSVSAEHGIGLLKREFLPYSRTAEELACMRRIKQALDPNGILNPGKLFE